MQEYPNYINFHDLYNCGKEKINDFLEVQVFYDPNIKAYYQFDFKNKLYRESVLTLIHFKKCCRDKNYGKWQEF